MNKSHDLSVLGLRVLQGDKSFTVPNVTLCVVGQKRICECILISEIKVTGKNKKYLGLRAASLSNTGSRLVS